jgi:chromosome segregation ATPase
MGDHTLGQSSTPKLRRKNKPTNNTEAEAKLQDLVDQLEEEKEKSKLLYITCLQKQETYIKREKEFKRTLAEYEKLLFPSQLDPNDYIAKSRAKITRTHQKVQEKVEMVQTQTARFLQDHERLIVRELNHELNNFHRRLLESQKNNSAKIIKLDKKKLHDEIVKNRAKVEKVETQNNFLHKTNTELKIQYKAHENDGNILNDHIKKLKQQNEKLRKELQELQGKRRDFKRFSENRSRAQTDRPKMKGDSVQIEGLKKMIELEKKNLRAARNAYTRELQDRNELENVLKLAIDGDLLSPRPTSKGKKEDTRKEVLKNLYFKTFPLKLKTKPTQETEMDSDALIEHLDRNIEYIEKLYSQHEENMNFTGERFLGTFS